MSGQGLAGCKVVLLHGLARSARSMSKIRAALRNAGCTICNIGYPSTRHSIEELASQYVVPRVRDFAKDGGQINFVTHSLGGIIVRQICRVEPEIQIGRVVMLGPPNHGSELVDKMKGWPLFRWANGPAGQQLGTESESIPNSLGPASFEVGIIAGNKPFLEPFKKYITGANDGKVSVESAKLQDMTDFCELPVTHWQMMRDRQVIEQTINFLKTGRFADAALPRKS